MKILRYAVVLAALGACDTSKISGSAVLVASAPAPSAPLPPERPGPTCADVAGHFTSAVPASPTSTKTTSNDGETLVLEVDVKAAVTTALAEICRRQLWTEESKRCVMKHPASSTNVMQGLVALRGKCGLSHE